MTDLPEDTKQYGMGKIFLQSIQDLIKKANYCAIVGDYAGWRTNLDCIIRKCVSKFTKEEAKEFTDTTKELDAD